MKTKSPKVDAYIARAKIWQAETKKLRAILLDAKLDEDLKWGKPCYAYRGSNLAIIQGFKDQCSVMFFKGSLLRDPRGVLVAPGENSQAARRMQFTSVGEITRREPELRAFVDQAVKVEQAGLKVAFTEKRQLVLADELVEKLDADPDLAEAFHGLTPGRQRAYNLFFTAAKQSKTRASRVEKCIPRILAGKGLADR